MNTSFQDGSRCLTNLHSLVLFCQIWLSQMRRRYYPMSIDKILDFSFGSQDAAEVLNQ